MAMEPGLARENEVRLRRWKAPALAQTVAHCRDCTYSSDSLRCEAIVVFSAFFESALQPLRVNRLSRVCTPGGGCAEEEEDERAKHKRD